MSARRKKPANVVSLADYRPREAAPQDPGTLADRINRLADLLTIAGPPWTAPKGQPSALVVAVEAFIREHRAFRRRARFEVIQGGAEPASVPVTPGAG